MSCHFQPPKYQGQGLACRRPSVDDAEWSHSGMQQERESACYKVGMAFPPTGALGLVERERMNAQEGYALNPTLSFPGQGPHGI